MESYAHHAKDTKLLNKLLVCIRNKSIAADSRWRASQKKTNRQLPAAVTLSQSLSHFHSITPDADRQKTAFTLVTRHNTVEYGVLTKFSSCGGGV